MEQQCNRSIFNDVATFATANIRVKNKRKSGLGLGTFIGKTLLERKKATLDFYNSSKGGAVVEIVWKKSDISV